MAWEDGRVSNVEALLDAADNHINRENYVQAKKTLIQALNSAKCIADEYRRDCYISLINDKLSHLE